MPTTTEQQSLDSPSALTDDPLVEAVGCGGLAWARTVAGALKTVDPLGHVAQVTSPLVLDVHRSARGDLLLLRDWSRVGAGRSSVKVASRNQTGFVDLLSITLDESEKPLAVADDQGAPVVVTDTRVYVLQQTWSPQELKPPLSPEVRDAQVSVAAPVSGGIVYLGLDYGEFGGGLWRIEIRTGRVTSIRAGTPASDASRAPELFDTVTGIVADPSEPDCVMVSAGLDHMGGSGGRILKVCGTSVRIALQRERARGNSVPFYGVVAEDGGFWTVSPEAVFRIGLVGPADEPLKLLPNSNRVYRASPNVVVICGGAGRCGSPLITKIR